MKAYGFKSFADKIEINFGKNINGIVGPNGSGKSNVVDAVRWVLGEQSVKSLRGDASTDIIFSGSKSRKPLNSASVTLVFDNSDLYLPIQYTEVSVKRVMYRTGENEYYLNNEKCRLKDITNLLTDTGVDKESFNIIGQGKIDEILSTKPSERRLVFESAAGVLKYKKRKEEAIKKLERTNANMERVGDILRELENNLLPLERQSKNAKKYLEYQEVLSELEISLMVHDIHFFHHRTNELETKISKLSDELVGLSSANATYDVSVLNKKDQLKLIEEKQNKSQTIMLEVTKNVSQIEGNIRLLKERQRYTDMNQENDEKRFLALKEDLVKIDLQQHSLQNDLEQTRERLSQLNGQRDNIQSRYQTLFQKNQQNDQKMECNRREQMDLKYKIEYLENSIQNDTRTPSSVKNILNNQRLRGVHNTISKVIQFEEVYAQAISIALGGASNYLIVDTRECAKDLVQYLKENKLGRATFFPIDTIKSRQIDDVVLKSIQGIDGFVAVASSLIQCQDMYRNIIENQLGNVLVCRDLDVANFISKQLNKRYKIVTLDGQVVNVGGSITGGSTAINQNILKDKYELDAKRLEYQSLLQEEEELEGTRLENTQELSKIEQELFLQKSQIMEVEESIQQKKNLLAEVQNNRDVLERERKDLEAILTHTSNAELENLFNLYYQEVAKRDNIATELEKLACQKKDLEQEIREIEATCKQSNAYISRKEKELKDLEIQFHTINVKLDQLLIALGEEYNMTYEAALSKYKLEIDEEIARSRVTELKGQIKEIGPVNVEAIEEYDKVLERYNFLNSQKEDLRQAEDTLLSIIQEMDEIMKTKFLTTFEAIRKEFKKVFREMFRGGEAELVLTDENNLLETGIEIQAVPTGKNLKSISLLSGGEKTFTAISLLFAILNVRPVPFCLLDEVEAALDDANVESFGHYLDKYRNMTQFILITHKKKTMEFVNILYGITMQESGLVNLLVFG